MNQVCLFIKVRTLQGKRDAVKEIWEKHLLKRIKKNKIQKNYFYCYDNDDPDLILMFEYYTDQQQLGKNAQSEWFQNYMKEVGPFLAKEPEVHVASPVWIKSEVEY